MDEHKWQHIVGASRQMLVSLRSNAGTVQPFSALQTLADAFYATDVGRAIGHPANIARFYFARDPRSDMDLPHDQVAGMLHTLYANQPDVRLAALRLWRIYASGPVAQLLAPHGTPEERQDAIAELVRLTEAELSELEIAIDQLTAATGQAATGADAPANGASVDPELLAELAFENSLPPNQQLVAKMARRIRRRGRQNAIIQSSSAALVSDKPNRTTWTRPMSKSEAAKYLRCPHAKKADWINQCVKDSTLRIRVDGPRTRQSFQFNLDAFPPELHDKLRATSPN